MAAPLHDPATSGRSGSLKTKVLDIGGVAFHGGGESLGHQFNRLSLNAVIFDESHIAFDAAFIEEAIALDIVSVRIEGASPVPQSGDKEPHVSPGGKAQASAHFVIEGVANGAHQGFTVQTDR
jgi:hypothetical protein